MQEGTDRWLQIKSLFDAALEWGSAERPIRLRQAAGRDEDVVREVEALLDSHERAGDFLIEPLLGAGFDESLYESVLDEQNATPVGSSLGSYRIVREIGRGGMGIVYLAERADQQYVQRVAIKVLPPGLANATSFQRFRSERQTLAVLDHPNIVKLLDGGTAKDGLLYLVMEHVDGTAIEDYCRQRKVPIWERLRLFCTICDAVHYAHQQLIVHRDLKSGNILVNADGMPKLLDFGISKLLDSNPRLTSTSQRPMTLDCASPEQVRGEVITTATDVYALSVLLYRLLTGQSPYKLVDDSVTQLERAICIDEPTAPSQAESAPGTLRRALKGDLDNIVLMGLRKEPQLRYHSAAEMAEDIRRHLNGRPVLARKATFAYQAAKFVRRNFVAVALSTVLVLSLVGGIITTSWQAAQARREKSLAQKRLGEIRKLANSVLFEFHDQVKSLPGATPARQYLLTKGMEYLAMAGTETRRDPPFLRELMQAYIKMGTIQGDPFGPNLGDIPAAAASYRKALELAEELTRIAPSNVQARRDLAEALRRSGDLLARGGDPRQALTFYRRSIEILEDLAGVQGAPREMRDDLAVAHYRMGDVLFVFGDLASAREHYNKMLEIRTSLALMDPSYFAQRDIAIAYDRLGELALDSGDTGGALAMHRRALTIREAALSSDFAHALKRIDVAKSLRKIGYSLSAKGDQRGALEYFRRAAEILEELWRADPIEMGAALTFARTLNEISHAATSLHLHAEATRALRQCLLISQRFAERPEARAMDHSEYAWYLLTAADSRLRSSKDALLHASQAVELSGRGHPRHLHLLALAQSATGDPQRAVTTAREALALMTTPPPNGPVSRTWREIELLVASNGSLPVPIRRPLLDQ